MKVVVVVKKGLGGDGVSQAARYIATRERDEEREGSAARLLFSESEERLNYVQANRLLGGGREPKTNDVLHLVISLHWQEDFDLLGTDEEARLAGVRSIARGTLEEMTKALDAAKLRWVAGIHRNTDNPHVHLLIHRDYVDRQTAHPKRLHTLPKEMRVSWEKAPDGNRIINPGILSRTFENQLEQSINQLRENSQRKNQEERAARVAFGQALIAADRVEQMQESLKASVAFGEWRRYRVTDEQGRSRTISELDLRQRADAVGRQAAAQVKFDLPAETRAQVQHEAVAQETSKYDRVIKKIRVIRHNELGNIEMRLQQESSAAQPFINKAAALKEKYENAGLPVPKPILARTDLAQLQNHAIFQGNAKRLQELEEIRKAQCTEEGEPMRLDGETGRLRAQLFVAQSRLRIEQHAAARFEETKHIRQWAIKNDERQTKYSLADIESASTFTSDQAKFLGARSIHWNGNRREMAREKLSELSRQRMELLGRIADERARLAAEITRRVEVVKALNEICVCEKERYRREGRALPAPLFTEQDLRELDLHAARRHDPEAHRVLTFIEREHDARSRLDPREIVGKRSSRARAREVMAGIELLESSARIERFNQRREQMMVIVKESSGADIRLARLTDVAPRSPLEHLLQPLLERSERRRAIRAAVSDYGENLHQQHEQNKAASAVLRETTGNYEQEFVRLNPGQPLPRPQFTAREISRLELQIIKENDPVRRELYAQLYQEALEEFRVDFSQAISLDPSEARAILDLQRAAPISKDAEHRHAMSFER